RVTAARDVVVEEREDVGGVLDFVLRDEHDLDSRAEARERQRRADGFELFLRVLLEDADEIDVARPRRESAAHRAAVRDKPDEVAAERRRKRGVQLVEALLDVLRK